VIADHARAAAFLIADGVVPGNLGRNYVCRMIIRRGYRFGGHLGLTEPFLANIASIVIDLYQEAYPELKQNRKIILNTITREEEQFQQTMDNAILHLEDLFLALDKNKDKTLSGTSSGNLYTTYGLPFEITRDIAKERGYLVDEEGFRQAMEEHRIKSGGGSAMGDLGGEQVEFYRELLTQLQKDGKLDSGGVRYDPYQELTRQGSILALIKDGKSVRTAQKNDQVEVIIPETPFYIESGGQVSDTGMIESKNWQIQVEDLFQPAAGLIVHKGVVIKGKPSVGDPGTVRVDQTRRRDIIRNHTATHLLHSALDHVIGEHARQAGSLVAPDHLRFDFTHNQALTDDEIQAVEAEVNQRILEDHPLMIKHKSLQEAIDEGARALFGEKYGENVRTIKMGDFSYELCGGTHCDRSSEVGLFLITSEGSTAAGIRRIEAVTGREAYKLVKNRFQELRTAAQYLSTGSDQVASQIKASLDLLKKAEKSRDNLQKKLALIELNQAMENLDEINGIKLLTKLVEDADLDTLRSMADHFRQKISKKGIIVIGAEIENSARLVASVTDDLVKKGFHAGDLVQFTANQVDGGGGGRPGLAEAGGKNPKNLPDALQSVPGWIKEKSAKDK
jgi:alanyl-tRNA synthetase